MLSLHHHECPECWFRCVLNSSSAHTVCSYKHRHHTRYQHWQWCLLIHPCLSLTYSFIFSSLSWNIYHLLTLVIQMSPNYYISFNLSMLWTPCVCYFNNVHLSFHCLIYTNLFPIDYTEFWCFLYVSAMNYSHLQEATVVQVPCSMLYNLSAINDELYRAFHNVLHDYKHL